MKTILFGAGAEIDFDICGGKKFAQILLGIKNTGTDEIINNLNAAIKQRYAKLDDEWLPKYISTTIHETQLIKASLYNEIYTDDSMSFYTQAELKKHINSRISDLNKDKSQKDDLLENYISYMGILDEKFHTIISPRIWGPHKFWDVINCYYRAYLYIVGRMIDYTSTEVDFYSYIIENPSEVYRKCRNRDYNDKNNYYELLKDKDIHVATTNYTPICESITGIDKNDIAYLNGRIGLFEVPRELRVYDIEDDEADSVFSFPYIFIQSGVKPIIENTQIGQFHRFNKFLDESDELVILGYRINVDDNHINSYIRKFISEGKTVNYLSFRPSEKDDKYAEKKDDILRRLRIDSDNLKFTKIYERNRFDVFKSIIK